MTLPSIAAERFRGACSETFGMIRKHAPATSTVNRVRVAAPAGAVERVSKRAGVGGFQARAGERGADRGKSYLTSSC